MDKRYGASQRNDCLMRIGHNKWELIYGYGSDGNMGWNWRQRFPYKPIFDEIKSIVTEQINAYTEEIYAAVLISRSIMTHTKRHLAQIRKTNFTAFCICDKLGSIFDVAFLCFPSG